MTDYIKRDDAIETVYQIRKKPADDEWANKWLTPLQDIPSADVVEVVRCKDCKYHVEFPSKCNKLHLTPMLPNYFCSFGERRE